MLARVFGLLSVLGLLSRDGAVSCIDRAGDIAGVTLHRSSGYRGRGHGVNTKAASVGVDRLNVRSPGSEFVLGYVEHISCGLGVREGRVHVSGNYGSVINEVEQLSCVLGQEDLLLGTLNDSSGMEVVCLLELLTGNVGELGFGDERLSLCADKLLLESDNLDRTGLLVLQLLDFIRDLEVRVSMFVRRTRRVKHTLALWSREG